jgi:hypothetical protein
MSSSSPAKAIADLIEGVTEKWSKQRKAEERDASARLRRNDRMVYYVRPVSLKDAARRVMRQAYMQASADGTLTCNPRQLMYCARPEILKIAEKDTLDSQYFCQTLLPDYIREHPGECASWDICWDDRGHFIEPHTGKSFGVGTLNVRHYVDALSRKSQFTRDRKPELDFNALIRGGKLIGLLLKSTYFFSRVLSGAIS